MLLLSSCIILVQFALCRSAPQIGTRDVLNLESLTEAEPANSYSCEGCIENFTSKNASSYTKLYFFSRESGDNYTELIYGNTSSIQDSEFNVNYDTKITIHGWRGTAFTEFEEMLRTTYHSKEDVNVIAVDWSKKASHNYLVAKESVVQVGMFLAQFLDWLVTETNVSIDSIHIIGHSLGAHIAGVTGEKITVGQVGRISGLDPAGPGFSKSSTSGRLDSSDAQFVDVIHTCGDWLGFYDACGHVDFYPNKGVPPQPGCIEFLVCSHLRAYEFFNESITTDQFVSTPCKNWNEFSKGECSSNLTTAMGEEVDMSVQGKYYLETAGSSPYALGTNLEL